MNRKLINWVGLLGIVALASYAAALIFSPMAFPGYNWMEQAAITAAEQCDETTHISKNNIK